MTLYGKDIYRFLIYFYFYSFFRDEVYCQLIKQLSDNPDPHSVRKGWTLMAFCLQTFPPTDNFVNFLEMFLQQKGSNCQPEIE